MQSRRILLASLIIGTGALLTSCSSCTEQLHPEKDRAKMMAEQNRANEPQPELTAEGTLPPKQEPAAEVAEAGGGGNPIDQKYNTFCSTCHGPNGDAQIPAAQAMNPKPRDFTDAAWQNKVSDEHIAKVIKEGGAAVGLSPTMAPWGGVLSAEEVTAMVQKVRSFKK